MKRFTAILLAAVMVVSFAGMAMAKPCSGPGGGPGAMGDGGPGNDGTHRGVFKAEKFAKELGLSSDQVKKLDAIKEKHKRAKLELKHKIEMAKLDIEEEMHKDKPSKSKINKAIDTISESQKEMLKMRIDGMLQTKEILTKEQFDKLKTMMNDKRGMGKKSAKKGKWFK